MYYYLNPLKTLNQGFQMQFSIAWVFFWLLYGVKQWKKKEKSSGNEELLYKH